MIFWSEKPEKNGPKVEAKLRKELGNAQPLKFETEVEGKFAPNSIGQALGDIRTYLFMGSTRPLHTFLFRLTEPKPFELRASVIKDGSVVVLGSLLFSAVLKKRIGQAVELERPKVFSSSKFIGEPGVALQLNNNKELISRINKFVRTSYQVGDSRIYAQRYLKIMPFEHGALLSINTLPRSKWFGLTSIFDVKAFLEIAALIEQTI